MKIYPEELDAISAYRLMTGVVVPRPIAWISSLSSNGTVNLAPFSCYSFLSSNPPIVGITIGKRRGEMKDTARNIHRTGEFVVHTADESLLEALHRSADEFPPDESEADATGLKTVASERVTVPRIAEAPIAMECKLIDTLHFGAGGSEFIVGQVQMFHLRDGLYVDGKIDSRNLKPVGRLAGPNYSGVRDVMQLLPNVAMGNGEVI
jgi:flavin reductase (DIM6/NTAB) family NADH-FMN oxidoreductase RutF